MKFFDLNSVVKKFPENVRSSLILCEEKELAMYIIEENEDGMPIKFIQGYVDGNFIEFDLYLGNMSFVIKGELKEKLGNLLQFCKSYELDDDELTGFIPFKEASKISHILGIKKSKGKKLSNFDDNKVFNKNSMLKVGKINLPKEEKFEVIDDHDYFIVVNDVLGIDDEGLNGIDFGSVKEYKGKPKVSSKPVKKKPIARPEVVKPKVIVPAPKPKEIPLNRTTTITKHTSTNNVNVMPLVLNIIDNTISELLLRDFSNDSYNQLKELSKLPAVKTTIEQVISRPMNQFIVSYLFKIQHKDAVPVKKWENMIKNKFKVLIG